MKKIISLFKRSDFKEKNIINQVNNGAEWVLAGEGIATRKFDGTCCMVRKGKLFKRFDAKNGKPKPIGFEPAQPPDPITGHQPGWIAVGNGPEDKYHNEAPIPDEDGTYELCGPKIQGNPEGFKSHVLVKHGSEVLSDCPRDFDGLREYFSVKNIEGIVWHHPDGRMVKIKAKDFGIKRCSNGLAYNRTAHLAERKKMMQQ